MCVYVCVCVCVCVCMYMYDMYLCICAQFLSACEDTHLKNTLHAQTKTLPLLTEAQWAIPLNMVAILWILLQPKKKNSIFRSMARQTFYMYITSWDNGNYKY